MRATLLCSCLCCCLATALKAQRVSKSALANALFESPAMSQHYGRTMRLAFLLGLVFAGDGRAGP